MGKITKDISLYQFQELILAGFNLSHIYALELIDDGKTLTGIYGHETYLNDLYNLGAIDTEFEITLEGKNILKSVYDKLDRKVAKKKPKEYDERFLEWYNSWPRSDDFYAAFKEKDTFTGIRTLRVNKDKCHEKYLKLLRDYSHEYLLRALDYEVQARRDQSYIRDQNMLTYMRSTEPYLNDIENLEKYIILMEKGPYKPKAAQSQNKNTDRSTVTI